MVGAEGDSIVWKGGVGFVLGVVEAVGARSCLEFNELVAFALRSASMPAEPQLF